MYEDVERHHQGTETETQEEMNYKHRIVCNLDDAWIIQERTPEGEWMSIHHCELKGEKGYYEAKAWLQRKEESK